MPSFISDIQMFSILNDILIKTRQLTSSVFIVFNYWFTLGSFSNDDYDGN